MIEEEEPEFPEEGENEELTAENADDLMLRYFSVDPYKSIWTGAKDAAGNKLYRKEPCDARSWDGFCAEYNISPRRLKTLASQETAEICDAKLRNILKVNGTGRLYDGSFTSLFMKNDGDWKDKSEITNRVSYVPTLDDLKLIQAAGIKTSQKLIDAVATRV